MQAYNAQRKRTYLDERQTYKIKQNNYAATICNIPLNKVSGIRFRLGYRFI